MIPNDVKYVFVKLSIHAQHGANTLATVSKEDKYHGILAKGHLLWLKFSFGKGVHQL